MNTLFRLLVMSIQNQCLLNVFGLIVHASLVINPKLYFSITPFQRNCIKLCLWVNGLWTAFHIYFKCILSTQEFDKKYNPTWHCIVGRNFGSYVTHETKHFIYFYLGQVAILLFKSGWATATRFNRPLQTDCTDEANHSCTGTCLLLAASPFILIIV